MKAAEDLVEEVVPLAGRDLSLLRPHNSDELLNEEAFVHEEFLPYWAELWPTSRQLAAAVAGRSLHGARTLELGCGLGLGSIAAALAGGRVTATDWAPYAVEFAARNARRNGLQVEGLLCDWAHPEPIVERAPWDLVIGSDLLYERRNLPLLTDLLPRLVDKSGEVLIADPGRPLEEAFLEDAGKRFDVSSLQLSERPRVRMHRLRLL
ncbi:MAG: class I SAM-dependent methyltransferase [Thermoleophilaceae bacterium]